MNEGGPDLLDFLAALDDELPDHIKVGEPFSLRPMLDRVERIHLCTRCRYTCTDPDAAKRHRCPPGRTEPMGSPIFADAIGRWQAMRREFEDYRERQHAAASHDCNGQLLNRTGRAAGIDSYSLFIGPRARAEKYASPELIEWWCEHGRMTVTDFEAQTHDHIGAAA